MTDDPFSNPTGTREEILTATYRSLQAHGYSDLTVDKIGAEFDKSKSLIYHHYDGKDELVLECLEFMLGRYREAVDGPVDDPRSKLESVLDRYLGGDVDGDDRRAAATLFELRAQAAHDEEYRDHFTRSDRVFEDAIASILRDGIERGAFRECDPDAVAATLLTTISGGMIRRATTADDAWVAAVRAELEAYLEARVYEPTD